jgi:hypothetical protein
MCMKKLLLLSLLIPTIKADYINGITYSMDTQILDRKGKTLKIKNYCIRGVVWMHITEQGLKLGSEEQTLTFTKAQLGVFGKASDELCKSITEEEWKAKY